SPLADHDDGLTVGEVASVYPRLQSKRARKLQAGRIAKIDVFIHPIEAKCLPYLASPESRAIYQRAVVAVDCVIGIPLRLPPAHGPGNQPGARLVHADVVAFDDVVGAGIRDDH